MTTHRISARPAADRRPALRRRLGAVLAVLALPVVLLAAAGTAHAEWDEGLYGGGGCSYFNGECFNPYGGGYSIGYESAPYATDLVGADYMLPVTALTADAAAIAGEDFRQAAGFPLQQNSYTVDYAANPDGSLAGRVYDANSGQALGSMVANATPGTRVWAYTPLSGNPVTLTITSAPDGSQTYTSAENLSNGLVRTVIVETVLARGQEVIALRKTVDNCGGCALLAGN